MPAITSGNWHRLSRSKFVVVAVSHPSDADAERTLRVPLYSFKTKPKPLTRSCSGFKTSLSNSSAKNSTRPSTKCCNSLYSTARSGRRLRRVSPKLMALTVLKVGRYKARLFSTETLQFPVQCSSPTQQMPGAYLCQRPTPPMPLLSKRS